MAKNADDTTGADDNNGKDDAGKTTEDDLRDLKYGKDGKDPSGDDSEEDDTTGADGDDKGSDDGADDDGKTGEEGKDGEDGSDGDDSEEDDSSEFVKELPNIKGDTVADYARNLEGTVIESNKEGKRLADENAALKQQLAGKGSGDDGKGSGDGSGDGSQVDVSNPLELYAKQKMDAEIANAFTAFQKDYPQAVPGTAEYAAFTNEVAILSGTILQSQKRLASPEELYNKAAVILGWEKGTNNPTDKEKLSMAVKGQAAVTKTSSSTKQVPKSKVTAEMIATNKKMYPDKTEEQIRKELEPFVK